jgi:superfamily I DNA/RNA helicase
MVNSLTSQQKQAAESQASLLVLEAGPGSGKTETLVRRYKFLLNYASPKEIMVTAFSREAAKVIRNRIMPHLPNLTPREIAGLPIGTLHSLAYRIVAAQRLSNGQKPLKVLPEDATINTLHRAIVDYADQDHVRWELLRKSLGGQAPINPIANKIANLLSMMSLNDIRNPDYVRRYVKSDAAAEFVATIAGAWLNRWRGEALYDHAAIIPLATELITAAQNAPYTPAPLHLLTDESQDYTSQQWSLADRLSRRAESLTIAGDPDQRIFSWRGAVPMPSCDGYPEMRLSRHLLHGPRLKVRLDQSFRCPALVLAPATRLVNLNHPDDPKDYLSAKEGHLIVGGLPMGDHAHAVATAIASVSAPCPSDVVVLARRQETLRPLLYALLQRQVPVRLLRGERDIDARLSSDLCTWIRLCRAPADLNAFAQAVEAQILQGVGPATANKLLSAASGRGNCVTLLRAVSVLPSVKGLQKRALNAAADNIEVLARGIVGMSLKDWFELLHARVGLLSRIENDIDSTRTGLLAEAWRFYTRAGEACQTAERFLKAFGGTDGGPAVTLSTFHGSKGLEWPHVFLFGSGAADLEGYPFRAAEPLLAPGVCNGGIAEERRLLHVAMTRSQKTLSITWEGDATAASMHLAEADIPAVSMTADEFVAACRNAAFHGGRFVHASAEAQMSFF